MATGAAGLSDILIRKDKQRITVDIYTARPGIVIGKSGVEVDALRKELHALTGKNVRQHQRDQAPRAGRATSCAVDRGAAAEPGQLPAGDGSARWPPQCARAHRASASSGRPPGGGEMSRKESILRGPRAVARSRGHRLPGSPRPATFAGSA